MALETGSFISDLNVSNPPGTDLKSQGDDHLRLVKSVLKSTFPNINGAVNPTPTQFNLLASMAALSVVANATNGAAGATAVAAGSDGQVMRRSGTALAFGALSLATAAAVTGVLPIANGGTGGATAAAARSALGLGAMALLGSPLGLANGGTTGTDAPTARTGLGLGSISTKALTVSTSAPSGTPGDGDIWLQYTA